MNSILPLLVLLSVTAVLGEEECKNLTLTAYRGKILSPGYPNVYPHNVSCWWKISAPKDHFIKLTFPVFDLVDPFWDCEKDFLKVVYGKDDSVILCNSQKPKGLQVYKSKSNVLQLQFKSDPFFMNGKGFEADYEMVDKNGKSLAAEEVDDSIFAETEPETSSTTTTTTTTTTTKATQAKSTEKLKTTSVIIKKITESSTKSKAMEMNGDDPSVDPGAMSGVVIGTIVGVVLIVFLVVMTVVTVRYRKQKNKRINLSNVVGDDGETLINTGKKYQKLNNKIVKIPTAEQFPL